MNYFFESKYSKFEKTLPDVSGKVFAITGTTSGTGFIAARTAAKHNGEVLLLNRPSSRVEEHLEKLKAAVPDGKFVPIDCDLQDFASVRKAIAEIKEKYTSLYCLANNAGIMATLDEITGDGYDKQMQTNHLSHFLLTKELFPLLLESSKEHGDARIVQHSSSGRKRTIDHKLDEKFFAKYEKDGMLGGESPEFKFLEGPEWERYFQSKLANSVFCYALHDKLGASKQEDHKNILSLAAHPGAALTNLSRHFKPTLAFKLAYIMFALFTAQSPDDGTMGLLRAMMDAKENVEGGTLYGPNGSNGYAIAHDAESYETETQVKEVLWKKSEEAIGASFDV
jgi:NAD(P)-dependent dehydrogenase (short-subunit alcohol dehydrogenase family)